MAATRRALVKTLTGMALGAAALLGACAPAGAPAGEGDMALGSPNAKVTLIEYASLTCDHCWAFHENDFPRLKADFIDTGKVRYVLREYVKAGYSPELALGQFQLARCMATDPAGYYAAINAMFKVYNATRAAFAAGQAREHLFQIAQSTAGMSRERFDACLADKSIADRINAVTDAGVRDFNITGTPTFIMDGRKLETNTYEGIKPLIEARLAAVGGAGASAPPATTPAASTPAPAQPPGQ